MAHYLTLALWILMILVVLSVPILTVCSVVSIAVCDQDRSNRMAEVWRTKWPAVRPGAKDTLLRPSGAAAEEQLLRPAGTAEPDDRIYLRPVRQDFGPQD
jgi:hypothetical protein